LYLGNGYNINMTSLVEPVADLVPLKAIFLDVDGVLCCNDYAVLQPELLANLTMAIENTGAVVVVSSDWRLFPSKFTELCRALKHRNIRVIGKTQPSDTEGARPLEIIRFLTTFHAKMKRQSKPFRIKRWLAVDDRQLPTEEGGEYMTSNRFTLTDTNVGLTFNIAMEIINKLNRTVPAGNGTIAKKAT
tara:strand:+ start:106 stop:672 length:567 start_codon:yes stop_codon:yes gene_type:complete